MEVAEIIKQLEYNDTGIFPREALESAIAAQSAITPVLIQTLKDCKNNLDELLDDSSYFLNIYALYLLAKFREKEAYPAIIDFFSTPGDAAIDSTGDVVTEDLGRIIASVFDGNLEPIKQLIENREANEYIRGAALDSLITLIAQNMIEREQVVEYFAELFQGKIERIPEDYLINKLVVDACDLCPIELKSHVEQVFEDGLIDQMFIGREEVDEAIELGIETSLKKLRQDSHHTFVDDVIEEMEWWACFHQANTKKSYQPFSITEELTKSPHRKKSQGAKKKKMQKQSRRQNRKKK
ncbi:hypothetical protein NIES4101_62340 [Calothrix sp. NIES-4101]|nr:hypothetical protein NIES4101_62340 [Calothrix sp. NIES-4101]